MMEPRDLPAVWRIARAQNRRDGTSYPVPPIFEMDEACARFGKLKPNVILALVTERRQGQLWRVRQAHVWLRTVEQMDFGGGRVDTEFSIAHLPLVLQVLRAEGYEEMHVFVPRVRLEDISGPLELQGLKNTGLTHFFREVHG